MSDKLEFDEFYLSFILKRREKSLVEKFRIAYYQKSLWYTNGGTLIVTDEEYIVKYLFHTVARFRKDKTLAEQIPDMMFSKGLLLTDGNQSIRLYFFPKEAERIYKMLKI